MGERIRTDADIAEALTVLAAADPRLAAAVAAVETVPLRLHPAGLAGLLRIVTSQQLSVASANAVFAKVSAALDPMTAASILAADEATLRAAGLSRQKALTFKAVAQAVADGLDLESMAQMDPEAAREALESIRGIGQWTADIYLMFCAGHPDIFPVGDLAVRKAAQRALQLDAVPKPEALAAIAQGWSPHRSTAARLMWAFYRVGTAAPAKAATPDPIPAGYPL